jgi:hypothetical protein
MKQFNIWSLACLVSQIVHITFNLSHYLANLNNLFGDWMSWVSKKTNAQIQMEV